MLHLIRKLIIIFSFNSCFLFLLIIGIQNSSNKSRVNLIFDQTAILPVGFIMGTSFIGGSIFGSLITINGRKRIK